ncbi:MAG: peptide chain release factor 1 [Betaproteobacteria bacterium]|nr:peptide chain release factor 1 [Betaproteobacteria bacterium]
MALVDQLSRLERRFLEIENLLQQPSVSGNASEFRRLSKEHSELSETIAAFREHKSIIKQIADTEELVSEASPDFVELAAEELSSLRTQLSQSEHGLRILLLPKDANDTRNVFLEIRAGAGGDEAGLFAGQLFRMYSRFCERAGFRVELMSMSENELGGVKEVIALVSGDNVYRTLKYESGVHRVQRVPATESQGRVHTSTVTVAVLPEAEDVEVNINETELRIDTYRASGAGGQHVNRTDSAVRITHLPSGLVVACQDERSQIKNRAKAMKILQAKLLELAQSEQEKAFAAERKLQVGRGDRSERIRTYNFPQSRVTDHRINHTTHAIQDFMEGDIGDMLTRLAAFDQEQLLKEQAERELG